MKTTTNAGEQTKTQEKLRIKTYHSNATIFGDTASITIYYDGDSLISDYDTYDEAILENMDSIKEKITDEFPMASNINDILRTINIYVSSCLSDIYSSREIEDIQPNKLHYSIELTNEIESLLKELKLDCLVEEFEEKVNLNSIGLFQTLSEDFIEKFQDKVNWFAICCCQKLSMDFIEKFKPFITKFNKRNQKHGKHFDGHCKKPIVRYFYINDKRYGECLNFYK